MPRNMNIQDNSSTILQVERVFMKDQVIQLVRDMIVSGRIAPGSKITERDVSDMLNVSRMPVRDALIELVHQGLLINKPAGRYVIELSGEDVRHFYRLRLSLEKLAVELAIQNTTPEKRAALQTKLDEMRRAIAEKNTTLYASSDFAIHELIWEQSGNPYLIEILSSMIGPIFLFISSQAGLVDDWRESLRLHEQLVTTIESTDVSAALQSIEAHVQHSLELALQVFDR